MDMQKTNMKSSLFSLGALVLCTSVAAQAATGGDASTTAVANKFIDTLQHQRYRDAAAMFAPGGAGDITAAEHSLKRIDDSVGGFSTIHPIATLPDGKSFKLEVTAHKNASIKIQKYVQLRYVSTATDGQPVFYELNLTTDSMPPQIVSFDLHFPADDQQSSKRANQLMTTIKH